MSRVSYWTSWDFFYKTSQHLEVTDMSSKCIWQKQNGTLSTSTFPIRVIPTSYSCKSNKKFLFFFCSHVQSRVHGTSGHIWDRVSGRVPSTSHVRTAQSLLHQTGSSATRLVSDSGGPENCVLWWGNCGLSRVNPFLFLLLESPYSH